MLIFTSFTIPVDVFEYIFFYFQHNIFECLKQKKQIQPLVMLFKNRFARIFCWSEKRFVFVIYRHYSLCKQLDSYDFFFVRFMLSRWNIQVFNEAIIGQIQHLNIISSIVRKFVSQRTEFRMLILNVKLYFEEFCCYNCLTNYINGAFCAKASFLTSNDETFDRWDQHNSINVNKLESSKNNLLFWNSRQAVKQMKNKEKYHEFLWFQK